MFWCSFLKSMKQLQFEKNVIFLFVDVLIHLHYLFFHAIQSFSLNALETVF